MQQYYHNRKLPFSNPLANALVVVVGALAIGASIVLGFLAFLVLGSLILMLAAIVGIRVWWFNRKLRRRASADSRTGGRTVRVEVIEGEYRVVSPPEDGRPGRKT